MGCVLLALLLSAGLLVLSGGAVLLSLGLLILGLGVILSPCLILWDASRWLVCRFVDLVSRFRSAKN
jgi:hypothetical protein